MQELTVKNVIDAIRESVPESLQEEWDNSGIQIGFEDHPVKRVLTCLEIDETTAKEAIDLKVDLIVSHHPLIFGGIRHIDDSESLGRVIQSLIRSGISVYSSHTPFDLVDGGNNDVLAEKMHLVHIETVSEDGFCKSGQLQKGMSFQDFIPYLAECFDMEPGKIRAAGEGKRLIQKVGFCTGAGSEYAKAAMKAGCDVMVTGDVKHHEALDILGDGFCIVDAGHYGTEKFFSHSMALRLDEILGKKVEIIETKTVTDPFLVL